MFRFFFISLQTKREERLFREIIVQMQATEFEGFFKENYSKIYYLALSLLHDEEAARDIVSDSFEYLFTHNSQLQKNDACNYLFVSVRHRCADYYRKQAVHQRYSNYIAYTSERVEDSMGFLEHEEQVGQILKLMKYLSPRTRAIMEAHYLNGKKYSEVAEEFGISESAVKKHVMQALKFFREKLSFNKKS